MASDTEGIATLFSMYDDDDDDDDDPDEPIPPSPAPPAAVTSPSTSPPTGSDSSNPNPNTNPSPESPSPSRPEEQARHQTLASPQLSSGHPPIFSRRTSPSSSYPPSANAPLDLPIPPRRGALAIVDYAHDEMAMSPEQEDGEIRSDIARVNADDHDADGSLEERNLSGTVHILTPNIQPEVSQHSDVLEQNQVGIDVAIDVTGTTTDDVWVEVADDISTDGQDCDPLSCFLPPSVTTKCSAALQQKINKFLAYKRSGKSFNAEVRNRKDYRNPDFLQHAVWYQEIDQIGTCFSKYVFDPYGYNKSDYYEDIEADMKRELERKEQEKKRNLKIEFVTGGAQLPLGASKIQAAVTGVLVSLSAEGVQKEARPNKKSKWDKVDGDIKNLAAPSGHDNSEAVSLSLALLASVNGGAGYAAFAQQKRKESEGRTNDYKSDRRT